VFERFPPRLPSSQGGVDLAQDLERLLDVLGLVLGVVGAVVFVPFRALPALFSPESPEK